MPHADEIDQILIIFADSEGHLGFNGNVATFEESMALLERTKFAAFAIDSRRIKPVMPDGGS